MLESSLQAMALKARRHKYLTLLWRTLVKFMFLFFQKLQFSRDFLQVKVRTKLKFHSFSTNLWIFCDKNLSRWEFINFYVSLELLIFIGLNPIDNCFLFLYTLADVFCAHNLVICIILVFVNRSAIEKKLSSLHSENFLFRNRCWKMKRLSKWLY